MPTLSPARKKDLRTYLAAMRVMAVELVNVSGVENPDHPDDWGDSPSYSGGTRALFRLDEVIPRHLFQGWDYYRFDADRFFLVMYSMKLKGSKKLPEWEDPFYRQVKSKHPDMLCLSMMTLYSVGGTLYLTYGCGDETPCGVLGRAHLKLPDVARLIADIDRTA